MRSRSARRSRRSTGCRATRSTVATGDGDPGIPMTEESPSSGPAPQGRTRAPEPRRRKGRRAYINIPGLARRGRATLRQVIALFFGGYVSSVEVSRRRGGRGASVPDFGRCRPGSFAVSSTRRSSSQPFPVQLRMRLGDPRADLRQARSDPEPAPGHPPGCRDRRAAQSSLRSPAGRLRKDSRDRRGRSRQTDRRDLCRGR